MFELMEKFGRVDIQGAAMFGLLTLAAAVIGILIFFDRQRKKQRQAVIDRGETVVGWIVQTNPRLSEPGDEDYPARVLITFDPSIPDVVRYLTDLAEHVSVPPPGHDFPDQRVRLSAEITGGPVVYLCHVLLQRDYLPDKRLTETWVRCKAMPGDKGPVFMAPPE